MTKLLRFIGLLLPALLLVLRGAGQTADFSFSPDGGCAPMVVSFTDLSSSGVTSWSWNFGNSTSATNQNPSITYSGPGVYPVTLTITTAAGTASVTRNVTVYDKPTASFTAAASAGCAPFAANFTSTSTLNSPGAGTFTWDFGDGNSGTGATTAHTYLNPGTYTVSLTVTNSAGCARTVSQTNFITANAKPIGGFGASQTTFCTAPGVVTFSNTTFGGRSPYTATWNFGDNTTGTGNTPAKTYPNSGYYTVTMIATDANGCSDTVVNPNYIGVIGQAATFTAPARICRNEEFNVANTTTGAVSSTIWDFGDGKPATAGNVATHVYDTSGTLTITMTTIVSGCTKVLTKTIIVNPTPAVTIIQSPSIPCPAPVNVTFTGSPTGTGYTVANYSWTFASGGNATGQTTIHNYTANLRDVVKLYVTSTDGCGDSITVDSVMIRKILMNVTPGGLCSVPPDTVAGCNPLTPTFGTELFSSLPPPPVPCAYDRYLVPEVTWRWEFGDNIGTSTAARPMYTYTTNGTYRVKCVITTANGCLDSAYRYVHVDSPVKPSFYAMPLVTCPKELVTFYNTTLNHKPGTRYTYFMGGDTTIVKFDPSVTTNRFRRFGVYNITLLSNYRGCIDSLIERNYITVHPPQAKFTDSVYCYPDKGVSLINQSQGATSYLWIFGDGATSTAASPKHNYASTGDYIVTLVAYNNVYNCTDTFRDLIHIFRPDITFKADDTAICREDFVNFQGAFGGTGSISYAWRIDNYLTAYDTASRYAHQFTTIGYHDITLYAISGNSCLDSFKRSRYVLSTRPTVMFTAAPHVGCEPLSLVFNDNSTNVPGVPAMSKTWVTGTGDSIRNRLNPTEAYIYRNRGIYTPKLIIVDSLGCADSLVMAGYVQVYKPIAVFTASDDSVCTYTPVRFRSYSTGKAPLRYNWTFGDNTTATTDTVTHVYTSRGFYHVRLIVTDSVGCADTMHIQNDIVVDAPRAAYTMSDSLAICPPLVIRFTNQSTDAASYNWNFGTGGGPVVVSDPVNTFSNPGLYNVFLVAINANGCTDTARSTVRVLGYAGALDYTPKIGCAPMEVRFTTPIPGIPVLTWDFGDGTTTGTTNSTGVSHTYPTAGAYLPKVIFSDGKGCSSLSEGADTIRVDRLTADFNWTTPCEGVPFTFTSLSTGIYTVPDSFSWVFGGSTLTASGRTPGFTYASSGTRPVTLTVRNYLGCTATVTRNVFVNPSPDLNAIADTAICPGDTARLLASNAVSYTWSAAPQNPAAGLSCTACRNPLAYPGGPAVYLVTGTDANGCVGHDSTRVVIQIKTTASTGNGGDICLGDSFRLVAGGAQKYEWMPSATIDSPFIASPLATPRVTTTYIVAAQEGTCLIDSQRVTVVVHAAPDFSAGQDKIVGLGSATTLEPKGTFSRITWTQDTTLSCYDCRNPNASPYYTRTYVAIAENEWGCKSLDSVTVVVRCNGSLVFIPNTFTPNGDGKNDYFYPQGAGFDRMITFRIFNRWGEQVFDGRNVGLNNELAGWDGRFKGQLLPPDTYVYSMTGICPAGDLVEFKGDVTIVR